jgi:hypothetical protein
MTDDLTAWLHPDDDPQFGASTTCRAAGLDRHPELDPDQDLATHAANIGRRRADQVVGLLIMLDAWRHQGTHVTPRQPAAVEVHPMFGSAPGAYRPRGRDAALDLLI